MIEARPAGKGGEKPIIDEPTVRKTIVMVRGYKRLRTGRHEYGEARPFPAPSSAARQ